MNAGVMGMGMMLAAGLALADGKVATPDERACQGAQPVMLMTPLECRTYVQQLHRLEAQGKSETLAELKRQHERLLEERATACPCVIQPHVREPTLVVAGDC